MPGPQYRGRFAPSPTGPLHFGSLIAAMGSYLQARSQNGEWWLRIDDIDPPREVAGAADSILRTLENFGFEWDGPVSYQSLHSERYLAAIEQLQQADRLYPCICSRKDIQASEIIAGIYPGTCRQGISDHQSKYQLRIKVENNVVEFTDGIQGKQLFDLASEVGDFTILRSDGYFSYQLATAIDDAEQEMTEVVRGCDLLDSTARQIYIQQQLGLITPHYAHLPVALNSEGQKLSKQTLARELDTTKAALSLYEALRFLGQSPPEDLKTANINDIWQWAHTHWQIKQVPRQASIPCDTLQSA